MASQINPKSWLSLDLDSTKQRNVFIQQLVSYLTDQFSSSAIGALAGASQSAINGGALVLTSSALGSVSTNQTVPCANACSVSISLTFTAAITLTLTNLRVGIPVSVKATNGSGGALVLKMNASTPSGTSYAISFINTAGAITNFVTTGWSASAGVSLVFIGNSVTEVSTPTLWLAAA